MEENRISLTALSTAYIRAHHARHDNPKIFDDFLAYDLLTDDTRATIKQQLARSIKHIDPERAGQCPDQATALGWSMRALAVPAITLVRARYAENKLEEAVEQGARQYVILGAGMDTFAFRRSELLDRLQVYEVDHPATQSYKRRRIVELGWKIPGQLHFVPIDFMRESLEEALSRTSHNQKTPTFFNWLGVTMFLTRDAVFATLHALARVSPPGSSVAFDYMDNDTFIPGRPPKRVRMMLESVRRLGEPVISGFDPSTLDRDLEGLGLCLQENLDPAQIQKRYFREREDGYYATEHAYLACATVK